MSWLLRQFKTDSLPRRGSSQPTLGSRLVRLALAASFVIALGQVPKDVNGWGKIRWDVTVAQAKALYGAHAQESNGGGNSTKYTEKLVIDNFSVGDINDG
jgi:hypothetical protein